MTLHSILALALAVFILGLTPGPGVFATLARALTQGVGPALIFVAGLTLGDLVYLSFAVLGLSYIAAEFSGVFLGIKIAGGVYLVYLGITLWRTKAEASDLGVGVERGKLRGFLSGLMLTLGNPKAAIFYIAFLPSFMDLHAVSLSQFVIAAGVISGVIFTTLSSYALLAARLRPVFKSPRAMLRLKRGAGSVMIGVGGFVISS